MISIRVSTIGGTTTVDMQGDVTDSLVQLQTRIAEALAVPVQRLALVSPDSKELPEKGSIGQFLHDGAQVTAVKMPCNVKASQYAKHIHAQQTYWDWGQVALKDWNSTAHKQGMRVEFPASTGLNVNMMPFVFGDEASLPEELRTYWPMVEVCREELRNHYGDDCHDDEIFFLTVQETEVQEGTSQRRPGLHVDRQSPDSPGPGGRVRWGGLSGGIFLASSVSNSTRVWPCRIGPKAIGDLGCVEHLRQHLGEGADLEAGEMVWLTDVTPHESLPLPSGGPRKFFRLVTSDVSHWYTQHSTPNPLGIVPDPDITTIVDENKFAVTG